MHTGVADTTVLDIDENFIWTWFWYRYLLVLERYGEIISGTVTNYRSPSMEQNVRALLSAKITA